MLVSSLAAAAVAQTPPNVLPAQRAVAQQTAQSGVPVSELADNAPASYTVKAGDSLWSVAGVFLKNPWRWPALWGMNLGDVRNPHFIYPGQTLVLSKSAGTARLAVQSADPNQPPTETIKVSPQVRSLPAPRSPIATIPPHLLEPFLAEPLVVDEAVLSNAPRVAAGTDGRVVLGRGDQIFVRGELGGGRNFRIFRTAVPLADPSTREVLGFETVFVGNAELRRPATMVAATDRGPAEALSTLLITNSREEARIGDRLLPAAERELVSYVPRAPERALEGRIIGVYGSTARNAGSNQIVTLNKGSRDGLERGHVLAAWNDGALVVDRSQQVPIMVNEGNRLGMRGDGLSRAGDEARLPDERVGLMLVFRVFERVSYALLLQMQKSVGPGDRFTSP
jgi:LysM repeat protein